MAMYTDDDLLPLSALQHLAFCERQWGLIHLEGIWDDNLLTAEGNILHERSEEYGTESRSDVRIVLGLRLRSLRLGLSGKADVVEFHRLQKSDERLSDRTEMLAGIRLKGVSGLWTPFPVEYKRGRPKSGRCDEVQLCAQALCLEEMLGVPVSEGALFYGKIRRRHDVTFDRSLREETESLAERLHLLDAKGVTPPATYGTWCKRCSLESSCQPKVVGDGKRIRRYLDTLFKDA